MITIDATNKKLGRVASTAAKILMGKQKTVYAQNVVHGDAVTIINASKADINEKKLNEKRYERYSGYPGGLKTPSMSNVIKHRGYAEVFRLAVYGMLPNNRLRAIMMKKLTITE